jgi:antitoxin component of MazEF toxin-antitoxin module
MKIPKSVASGIGLQAKYRVEVMLGNGRTVTKVTKQGKFAKRLRRGIVQVVG